MKKQIKFGDAVLGTVAETTSDGKKNIHVELDHPTTYVGNFASYQDARKAILGIIETELEFVAP